MEVTSLTFIFLRFVFDRNAYSTYFISDGMSDSAVGPADVEHVAELARVDLDEGEIETFSEQFAEILEYFEALDEVPEIEHEPELKNVMRSDEIREGLNREDALANAPESEDGYFKGPNVS